MASERAPGNLGNRVAAERCTIIKTGLKSMGSELTALSPGFLLPRLP